LSSEEVFTPPLEFAFFDVSVDNDLWTSLGSLFLGCLLLLIAFMSFIASLRCTEVATLSFSMFTIAVMLVVTCTVMLSETAATTSTGVTATCTSVGRAFTTLLLFNALEFIVVFSGSSSSSASNCGSIVLSRWLWFMDFNILFDLLDDLGKILVCFCIILILLCEKLLEPTKAWFLRLTLLFFNMLDWRLMLVLMMHDRSMLNFLLECIEFIGILLLDESGSLSFGCLLSRLSLCLDLRFGMLLSLGCGISEFGEFHFVTDML
jgi:hypothetical protein